jgi:hypothetical protein
MLHEWFILKVLYRFVLVVKLSECTSGFTERRAGISISNLGVLWVV